MIPDSPSMLSHAADARRRELPVMVATTILTGGLSAAILGGAAPVGWAAAMSIMLVADAELHRRLDVADAAMTRGRSIALAAWAFTHSALAAALPAALWLDGQAAGAAAAIVLWVAGVVRWFNGAAGAGVVAAAGAAPSALALMVAPFLLAASASRPDWDLAIIATIGGLALMSFVAHARFRAIEAERALEQARTAHDHQQVLARLMLARGGQRTALFDRSGAVLAEGPRADWTGEGEVRARWLGALARVRNGEVVRCAEERIATDEGTRWFSWEARPWRSEQGEVLGMLAHAQDITALVAARHAEGAGAAIHTLAKSA